MRPVDWAYLIARYLRCVRRRKAINGTAALHTYQFEKTNRRTLSAVLLVQVILLAALLAVAACGSMLLSSEPLIQPMCAVFVVIVAWSIWSWRAVTGSLYDPYVLFLMTAALFNGGHAILEVFHANPYGILDGAFPPSVLFKTLFLVSVAIIALHTGALVALAGRSSRGLSPKRSYKTKDLRLVGWILVIISVVPAAIYLKSCMSIVMAEGYFGLYRIGFAIGSGSIWRVLSLFLVPGTLFLLAGSKHIKWNLIIASGLLLLFSLTNLFLGLRTAGAYPILAYLWLWHRCIQPISRKYLIAFGLAMLTFILPLIATVRSVSGDERLSAQFALEAISRMENPVVASVREMGESMRAVAHTIQLVPGYRQFDMGVGYAASVLTIVPSLYWRGHQTYGEWLTWKTMPGFAAIGGGTGFSFVAEAFINFGWLGVPIVVGLIGFLVVKLTRWAISSGDPARMAMLAAFIAFFLQFSRGESAGEVGRLFWCVLMPFLAVSVLRAERAKTALSQRRAVLALPADSGQMDSESKGLSSA